MNLTIQVAEVLRVSPNQIRSVTELAWVYCVVVAGRRAAFVSKKKVVAVKLLRTRWDIAQEVASLIGGKPWKGGDKVRVYKGDYGYVEVGAFGCNCKSLKNSYHEYNAIRKAGLDSYETVAETTPVFAGVNQGRQGRSGGLCLNCDIWTAIRLGRGYCTDCYGEC
jgi:hypothetical protein